MLLRRAALVWALFYPVLASNAGFDAPPVNYDVVLTLNASFAPLATLDVLSETGFTTLDHPAFPRFNVRIRRNDLWDGEAASYTGYVDIEMRHTYFCFLESRGNPEGDDVMLWTSGVPTDLVMERLYVAASESPYLPHWLNSKANVFFVDQPTEAGFSYIDHAKSTLEEMGHDVAALVAIFFAHFPQFQGRAFHVGETHGGQYASALVAAVHSQNALLVEAGLLPINLASIRVGTETTDLPTIIELWNETQCSVAVFPVKSCAPTQRIRGAAFDMAAVALCVDALLLPKSSPASLIHLKRGYKPPARLELLVADGQYRLGRKIGSGSFGDIYRGIDVFSGEEVAVKLERVDTLEPKLESEARLHRTLIGGPGIPGTRWYGVEGEYRVLVLELLGLTLEDLFVMCNRKLSLKTLLQLANQMLTTIEYVHSQGLVHRDIKPFNFLMGLGKRENEVNLIDFGLSGPWRDPNTHEHIPFLQDYNDWAMTRNFRYGSLSSHNGIEQTRRDDLEALGYMFVHLFRGALPWTSAKAQKLSMLHVRTLNKKRGFGLDKLTHSMPVEFAVYLNYTRQLGYEEEPDYAYLRRLFTDVAVREGIEYDGVYDWTATRAG